MHDVLLLLLTAALTGALVYAYQQRQQMHLQKDMLVQKDTRVAQARDHVVEVEKAQAALQQQIDDRDAQISKLKAQIEEQDKRIERLRRNAEDRHSITANLRAQVDAHQRETRQSRAFYSTISNVTYDVVLVLDQDTTIIALNRSADVLFGERNPVGEKLAHVIDAPDLLDIIARALNENEGLEEQVHFADRYYRARTQVMRYDEEHVFIGVALQNITQLVKLNRARRDLVGNISHELRTPITNIRLVIDSLFLDADKPKRKASIESLKAIRRHIDTLELMSQELLDLSMIESGQAILRMVEVPLAEMVEEAVMRLEDQLEAKDLHVVQHIPEKIHVLCDRDQARRVLVNLIHNATKWSPPNEAITVSATNGGEEITISIFDNGPGVPEGEVSRIFERFYQVDTARTNSQRKGTGLGLAICKHIVKAHGGDIWAESNDQGQGGRFFFTLLSTRVNQNDSETTVDNPEEVPR